MALGKRPAPFYYLILRFSKDQPLLRFLCPITAIPTVPNTQPAMIASRRSGLLLSPVCGISLVGTSPSTMVISPSGFAGTPGLGRVVGVSGSVISPSGLLAQSWYR